MVYKLVYLHSVFELSAVPILAWSGVGCLDFCMCRVLSQFIVQPGRGGGGQNHDWTAPHHPCTQHSCSPQLGSVAQPQRMGQNRCPVIHGGSPAAVCAQSRRGRGIAHLVRRRQLCSRHATQCLNFAISSNTLAILDSTAAHGQPLLVPLPPLHPFQPAAFNCGTSALTTRGLTVPDMQLVKDHVQTEG